MASVGSASVTMADHTCEGTGCFSVRAAGSLLSPLRQPKPLGPTALVVVHNKVNELGGNPKSLCPVKRGIMLRNFAKFPQPIKITPVIGINFRLAYDLRIVDRH